MGINICVTGGQWGDEGKGKVIDILSKDFDVVVRFQGGSNAGHTVVIDGKTYFLHLVPSGIFHDDKVCIIGNGVVVDPFGLKKEIENLKSNGVKVTPEKLIISDRAHLVLPFHKTLDKSLEEKREFKKIGTTGRGIGPAYATKALRTGIRVIDLYNDTALKAMLKDNVDCLNFLFENFFQSECIDIEKIYQDLLEIREYLKPFVSNTVYRLNSFVRERKSILFEGAQASLLDIDHGTYPFVTSSSVISGAVSSGAGFPAKGLNYSIGIFKTYCTRVGNGPFPTEAENGIGDILRSVGGEFGTTTGRPRRCGWFDLVAAKYASIINGYTHIALMKLDVLSKFEEIPVCIGYRYKGTLLKEFPSDIDVLEKVEPYYKFLKGWGTDITGIKNFDDLPEEAKDYVKFISDNLETKLYLVSVGPDRNESIIVDNFIEQA